MSSFSRSDMGRIAATISVALAVVLFAANRLGAEELMLSDFESKDSMRVIENRGKVELVAEHATQGKMSGKVPVGFTIVAGGWTRLPKDWSGYDELRLDVFNPGEVTKGSLWITDDKGNDYWNRHNGSFNLRKGANTIVIPVGGLYRGEKGTGKFLDPKKISQLTLSLPKKGAQFFYLDNFRLVKGAGKATVKLLLSFEDGEARLVRWGVEDYPKTKPGTSTKEIVEEHATDGKKALKVVYRPNAGAIHIGGLPNDVGEYDTLEIDCFNTSEKSVKVFGWFRDALAEKTGGYWDRHNYSTNIKPGASTLRFAIGGMYRGEKGSGKFLDSKLYALVK